MADALSASAFEPAPAMRRVIGRVRGARPGPTLICIGGIHGNEPAGVLALRRVVSGLEDRAAWLHGEFLALAGNLGALARRRRFLDHDLNRLWLPDRIAALRRTVGGPGIAPAPGDTDLGREAGEQHELLAALGPVLSHSGEDVYVVDLHTTSGTGPPFATIGDTLRNRAFSRCLPIPVVLGLEEQLDGTLLEYFNNLGFITLGVEGGQHEDPASVDHLEAAVWITLAAARLASRRTLPEYEPARRRLEVQARGLPAFLEVRYRHPVTGDDAFEMNPGYFNFQPLRKGEVLARCRDGEIRSPDGGRILMPLYQELGDDGFFLVREVSTFWLGLSSILRRLHFDVVAPWLFGVHRHPVHRNAVVIDRRIARWFAVEIFHLLGYRRELTTRDGLVMSRRRHDRPPRLFRFGLRRSPPR